MSVFRRLTLRHAHSFGVYHLDSKLCMLEWLEQNPGQTEEAFTAYWNKEDKVVRKVSSPPSATTWRGRNADSAS